MTKLLDQAIAEVRELPEDDQDAAADALFAHLADNHRQLSLAAEQVEDVKHIQQGLREGRERLISDQELAALWSKCGL